MKGAAQGICAEENRWLPLLTSRFREPPEKLQFIHEIEVYDEVLFFIFCTIVGRLQQLESTHSGSKSVRNQMHSGLPQLPFSTN